MSRTESLRVLILTELKKVCANVHYVDATATTPFPYIVYSLEHYKGEVGYNYNLELNLWDKHISPKQVEEMADTLEELLDDTIFKTDAFTASFDLNTRNTIEDTDKSLKRRRLLFNLSYFN